MMALVPGFVIAALKSRVALCPSPCAKFSLTAAARGAPAALTFNRVMLSMPVSPSGSSTSTVKT